MDRKMVYFAKVLKLLRQCDVALEVVDARDAIGTRTKKLDIPMRNKMIIVASKADLLPKDSPRLRSSDEIPVVYFSARTREGFAGIFKLILGTRRAQNVRGRGLKVRVAVFGMPNTGKSSLINCLRGKHVANTGFRPGLTKGEQWISLGDDILLCDSPGIVRFGMSANEMAEKGALDAEKLDDPERMAHRIIEKFARQNDKSIFKFYDIAESRGEDALEKLARRRGLLLKGGEPNLLEAAKIIIRDLQRGKFVLRAAKIEGI